ncbi:MAG: anti-sigma factor antagonist [Oscillospiraceae bacterium]
MVEFVIEAEKKRLTAKIYGDIDHHSAKYLRNDIDMKIDDAHPHTLIIDFSKVTFMDSSGIGLVMGRYKKMKISGGEVFVANPPAYIKKVMNIAGINQICRIISTEQEEKINAEKNN